VQDPSKYSKLTINVPTDLLQEAKARCRQDGVTVSFVIRAALRDYLRYGLEVRIQREPSEEDRTESFF
jgi:metal-responsive CopG/Arc/MetJ family transcriptional regulator